MARFKNVSGEARHLGRVDGPVVAAGDVAQVDGDVTKVTDDAYILGAGDEARAWPKSTWELLDEPKSKKAGE
ncbi:hypothetical protein [Nonomuraea sp. NPDC049400]|uniref:hypothetical protein n=1 Tax=Nonomuraea sp. NPDC049400 TaxID=3364352 RepID=UPI0037B66C9A